MRYSTAAFGLSVLALVGCATNQPPVTLPTPAATQLESDVPANLIAPRIIKKVESKYPAALRRERIQGNVLIQATIDTEGIPRKVRVVRSDHPALADLALRAVEQWRFKPGTMDGKPVDVLFQTTVTFALNK